MYKIYLVEDDAALTAAVEKTLSEYGNEVKTVSDFRNVTGEFLAYQPQRVLLDIKLLFMTVKIFFQKEVSEGVDDNQRNALKKK